MPDFKRIFDDAAHYSLSCNTGSIAASAATKLIWYCRNSRATSHVLIRRVEIEGVIATTAFAAGQVLYTLHIARGFTAENGTPGGTALTLTGANNRLRANFPSTGLNVMRVASTAALAAPTWALDANPIGSLNSHSSAGPNSATPIIGSQWLPQEGILFDANLAAGDAPIILGANEGLAIQATVPATGVWIAGINMKWAETDGISA